MGELVRMGMKKTCQNYYKHGKKPVKILKRKIQEKIHEIKMGMKNPHVILLGGKMVIHHVGICEWTFVLMCYSVFNLTSTNYIYIRYTT